MPEDFAYAAAPFDHEKADIILRSSDNVDFRIFKLFLSLTSPSFEAMFQTPQPAPAQASNDQEIKDDLVVIRVRENSKTLDTLLRFCYPCTLAEDPKLEVLKDLVDVLEATRTYALKTIERKVLEALSNPTILAAEPLRCFVIARRGRAHEQTLLAAKYTLTQPLIPSWFQEISLITAADLLTLLTYHQKCGDAVYALRNDLSWIQSHYGSKQSCPWLPESEKSKSISVFDSGHREGRTSEPSCRCAGSTASTYKLFNLQPSKWWEDFMVETFVALRDKPCRATVESFAAKTVQSVRAQGCPACSVSISERMEDFSKLMVRKVEEVVSKVRSVMIRWEEYPWLNPAIVLSRSQWVRCSNSTTVWKDYVRSDLHPS